MQKIVGRMYAYCLMVNTTDTQTDTKLTTNNTFFEYKIHRFLIKSTLWRGKGNDAEKDSVFAESDNDE